MQFLEKHLGLGRITSGQDQKNSDKFHEDSQYKQQKMINNSPLLRIRGSAARELLHRSIVAIRYENPLINNTYFNGSGVLLSNDLVLTAAHNLYDKEQNHWQGLEFQKDCFKIYQVTQCGIVQEYHKIKEWRYLEEFKTCKPRDKLQYDYALIKLEPNPRKPITYDKFLELRPPCKCVLERNSQVKLEIYGFPTEQKNYEPLDKESHRLKLFQYGITAVGAIKEAQPKDFKITYAINTQGGHSGCPVAVGNQICAIHSGGAGKEKDKWNIGRLITPDLIQNIKAWARELQSIPYSVKDQVFCPHQQQNGNLNQETQQKKQIQPHKVIRSISQIASTYIALELTKKADLLKIQYKYQLALEQYKKVIAIYEQLNEKESPKVAEIIMNIGDIYSQQGKQSLALEAYERGKTIFLEKEGEESEKYAMSLERIAGLFQERGFGDYDIALEYNKKALSIWQKIKETDSLQAGRAICNIGTVYKLKGDNLKALNYFNRSLQTYERAGNGNNILAANTHNNIGVSYENQDEYSLAIHHYQKALEIYQSIQGKDIMIAASTMMNIGIVYYKQGQFSRAVEIYKQTIAIYQKHELRRREYATVHYNLGVAYNGMKEDELAVTAYKVALSIFEYMGFATGVMNSLQRLVRSLINLGELEELDRIMKYYRLNY